jgi:NAD(P)-dependent dehydrogenase (short-subunit alcohol dehydrogenase family)
MKRVLILGGYGGFGARLSQRLAKTGWHVIIAGRNLENAQRLAGTLQNAIAEKADRNGDLLPLLSKHKPLLLVDAAGPFQGNGYQVAEACIMAGIAYLDLADARDFVSGVSVLDAQAKAAGVGVISGASSVPALSGAVVRHLAQSFDRVNSIEMAISASSKASAGLSVASAILSYVGKPVKLWTGRDWRQEAGWSRLKWQSFAVAEKPALRRMVALADIPDHQFLPDRIAGKPTVTFRAGPEFALQTIGLWLLGWLVRLRVIRSLSGLSNIAKRMQALLSGYGSDRSAMSVTLIGQKGDSHFLRRWTLLAEDGDGPEIPVLAAQLLAGQIMAGEVASGARDAGELLTLDQFAPLFEELAISTELHEQELVPLYKRIMGESFVRLPAAVRTMHDIGGAGTAHGEAEVERGSSLLAKLVCNIMRFPPAGKHKLAVYFTEENGVETWTRDFGGHRFSSRLSEANGQLVERFGPMRFYFDLPATNQGLTMVMRRWSAFYIAMPLWLGPKSEAREWAEGQDFWLDVPIDLPLIGRLIHYRGWLRRD